MQTGVFMESHLCVLSLCLLINLCLAAPGLPGTQGEVSEDARPSAVLANPFGSGEENRKKKIWDKHSQLILDMIQNGEKLLQSYIQSSLKDGEGAPEISSWEQEVFFLFRLYDYDRSGLLDGLEMMKLLSDYNSHRAIGSQANELIVSMVDFLLQTQDLNQDGLLAPSELLAPPLPLKKDSGDNNSPHQEKENANLSTDGETAEAVKQTEEAHEELQPQDEEQPQQDIKTQEEELIKQADEQHGQQVPEAPRAEQGQDSVHVGQPEM